MTRSARRDCFMLLVALVAISGALCGSEAREVVLSGCGSAGFAQLRGDPCWTAWSTAPRR